MKFFVAMQITIVLGSLGAATVGLAGCGEDRRHSTISGTGDVDHRVVVDNGRPDIRHDPRPNVEGARVMSEREPNDRDDRAQDLGTVRTPLRVEGSVADKKDVDWYVFRLSDTNSRDGRIQILFRGGAGDLRAAVYRDPAHERAIVNGVDAPDSETISLAGLAPGTYYLRVWGYKSLRYTAEIAPSYGERNHR